MDRDRSAGPGRRSGRRRGAGERLPSGRRFGYVRPLSLQGWGTTAPVELGRGRFTDPQVVRTDGGWAMVFKTSPSPGGR